jgi:SpoIIAA-like
MLKLIPGLPDDVVGIEAVGKVEAADYREVLDPAAAAAIKAHGKVRLLYLLGDGYDGYTAAAMWEDTRLGFHDLSAWERIAVVTDHGVLSDAVRVFGWLIPGDVRTYAVAQLDDAKAWVAEGANAS